MCLFRKWLPHTIINSVCLVADKTDEEILQYLLFTVSEGRQDCNSGIFGYMNIFTLLDLRLVILGRV